MPACVVPTLDVVEDSTVQNSLCWPSPCVDEFAHDGVERIPLSLKEWIISLTRSGLVWTNRAIVATSSPPAANHRPPLPVTRFRTSPGHLLNHPGSATRTMGISARAVASQSPRSFAEGRLSPAA